MLFKRLQRFQSRVAKNGIQQGILGESWWPAPRFSAVRLPARGSLGSRFDDKPSRAKSSHVHQAVDQLLVGLADTGSLHPLFQDRVQVGKPGTQSHVSKENRGTPIDITRGKGLAL